MTEWRTYLLGELSDPGKHAFATGPFGSSISKKFFVDKGIPVIRGSNLSVDVGVILNEEGFVFVDEEKARMFSRSIARRGDLVFTCWGTVGQVGFISSTTRYERYVVSNKQMKMTPDSSRVEPLFLYYLLSSPRMVHEVTSQAIGTSVPGFNLGQLKELAVRIPPLARQRNISRALRAFDALIENNRRRIEILEGMAWLLYREWFVHFRFPGHEDVKLVDSDLGPIPEGWTVLRLVEVCSLVMGQSPKSEYYNDVGEGLPFHQGVTDFGRRFPTHTSWTTIDKRVAEPGDVLFSVRAPVGRINVAPDRLVIGRGLSAVRALDGHQNFLLMQLRNQFAIEDSIGGGTIFNAVTKGDMESINLLRPADSVVGEFEAVAAPMADLIANLSRQNVVLREARNLLLPRLVAGELDVSELDFELGAAGV